MVKNRHITEPDTFGYQVRIVLIADDVYREPGLNYNVILFSKVLLKSVRIVSAPPVRDEPIQRFENNPRFINNRNNHNQGYNDDNRYSNQNNGYRDRY